MLGVNQSSKVGGHYCQNNELEDATTIRTAAELGGNLFVGLSLQAAPFTLHFVISSTVNMKSSDS